MKQRQLKSTDMWVTLKQAHFFCIASFYPKICLEEGIMDKPQETLKRTKYDGYFGGADFTIPKSSSLGILRRRSLLKHWPSLEWQL